MRFENVIESNRALSALPNAEATKSALRAKYSEWDRNLIAAGERIRSVRGEFGALMSETAFEDPTSNAQLENLLEGMSYGSVARG